MRDKDSPFLRNAFSHKTCTYEVTELKKVLNLNAHYFSPVFVNSLTSLPFCTSESLPLLLKLPASYMHAQWCVQHQTHYPLIKKQQQNTQNGCLARKQGGDKYGCPKATWSSQQFLFLGSQKNTLSSFVIPPRVHSIHTRMTRLEMEFPYLLVRVGVIPSLSLYCSQ